MKKIVKKFGMVLVMTITLVTISQENTYAERSLSIEEYNIPSNWAKLDIDNADKIDLIPENIQGNYKESINREEFSELAVNLYEALSRKKVTQQVDNPFSDTDNPKVAIASQLGIVKGNGDGKFYPNEKINREEASVIIYNTLKAAKPKYKYPDSSEYDFEDHNMISKWASNEIGYLYGIEVINGDESLFNPKGETSREEAIVLVKRLYDKVMDSERSSRGQIVVSRVVEAKQEDSQRDKLKELISKELGKPYQYGATGPNSYDCSGLTYSIFGQLGISIPRVSRDQIKAGVQVAKSDLEYGDLILFARDGKNINHVGIYVGDGQFVHSPQTGDVVKVSTLSSGYYANSYYAARRIIQ